MRFEKKLVKSTEPVRALVEAGVLAFDGLFYQGAANRIVLATFGAQRFQGLREELEGAVDGRSRAMIPVRGRLLPSHGGCGAGTFLRRFDTHQVVVIDEFVAVADKQIGGRFLDPNADDGLGVLAQFADKRGEIRVAADDDERVDVALRVAEVERIDDHADVGGIFARLAHVRDLD